MMLTVKLRLTALTWCPACRFTRGLEHNILRVGRPNFRQLDSALVTDHTNECPMSIDDDAIVVGALVFLTAILPPPAHRIRSEGEGWQPGSPARQVTWAARSPQ